MGIEGFIGGLSDSEATQLLDDPDRFWTEYLEWRKHE